jgi:hypothetical protein
MRAGAAPTSCSSIDPGAAASALRAEPALPHPTSPRPGPVAPPVARPRAESASLRPRSPTDKVAEVGSLWPTGPRLRSTAAKPGLPLLARRGRDLPISLACYRNPRATPRCAQKSGANPLGTRMVPRRSARAATHTGDRALSTTFPCLSRPGRGTALPATTFARVKTGAPPCCRDAQPRRPCGPEKARRICPLTQCTGVHYPARVPGPKGTIHREERESC